MARQVLLGLFSIETNGREMVCWFQRDRTNTKDAERLGRPNPAVVPENIKEVHKMVFADRKLKLHEIADSLTISEGSVFTILHEHLSMRKLCLKRVPRLLTVNQKQQRVVDSERCLQILSAIKRIFLHGMWQWMKHGFITTLQSQIDSQLSGGKPGKAVRNDQKHNRGRKGYCLRILGCARYFIYRLPWERKSHQ